MRKYIPTPNYWFYFLIALVLTFIPLELFKNKQLETFQNESYNKFQIEFNNELNHYNEIAKIIYLNNLNIYENLLSIEQKTNNNFKEKVSNKEYEFNFELNTLSFYFLDNSKENNLQTKINFNLETFLNELNEKSSFNIKKIDERTFASKFNIKKLEKYYFFTNKSNTYLGFFKEIDKKDFLVYLNISNSSYENINSIFYLVYAFIFFIYMTLLFSLHNYFKNRTKLKQLSHIYGEISQAIDDHILMIKLDLNDNITYASNAFCKWSSYSKKDLIGKKYETIVHDDVSKNFQKKIKNDLLDENIWEGEFKNKDKFGNSMWSKGVVFKNHDEKNKVYSYSLIFIDISDNKQMIKINDFLKEELSNKLNEIQIKEEDYKDRSKVQIMSKILDSIAHQWKKPISNISIDLTKLSLYLIEKGLRDDELRIIHQDMNNELKNLSISLNNFKSMFVKDNINDKYNLYSVLKDSISICQNDLSYLNVRVDLNSEKHIECFGFSNEIREIFVNLVKYSVDQFKLKNTEEPKVGFTVIKDNKDVLLKYVDNTQVLSTEIITEVLQTKDDELLTKDLNINLHLIKLLVQKTGSKIWFEHVDDQVVFYIKLVSVDRRKKGR